MGVANALPLYRETVKRLTNRENMQRSERRSKNLDAANAVEFHSARAILQIYL